MEANESRRNSGNSENENEKEFLAILKQNDSSDLKSTLKLKIKPLRNHNGIQVFLTKEDDASFYYSLDITDEDFRELRIRQGLLVDFTAFPANIFRLLDTCQSESLNENPKYFPQLQFLDSRGDEVSFDILEINLFRRLAHLSLKLRRGNDAKIKEHLGDCLKQLKLEHHKVLNKLAETSDALKNVTEEKSSIEKHMEKLVNICVYVFYRETQSRS